MKPLSPIHPLNPIPPGRYMLDTAGILWPPEVRNPAEIVAAVVVLAPGQPTRRLLETEQRLPPTDDLRSAGGAEQVRLACADEAGEREARYREAKRLTTAHPAEVMPRPPEPPLRSLARKEKPSYVPRPPVNQGEADEDALFADFSARLKAKQAARTKTKPKSSEPKIDTKRVAAVHRELKLGPPPKKVPTRRALADGECHACGTRTTIGCEHFLPYQGGGR